MLSLFIITGCSSSGSQDNNLETDTDTENDDNSKESEDDEPATTFTSDAFVSEFGKFYNVNNGENASDKLSENAEANINAIWTLLANYIINSNLADLDNDDIERAIGKLVVKEILDLETDNTEESNKLTAQLESDSETFSSFLTTWGISIMTNISSLATNIGYILNTKETLIELAEYLVKYYSEDTIISQDETLLANLKSNTYYTLCSLIPYLTEENITYTNNDITYTIKKEYTNKIPENKTLDTSVDIGNYTNITEFYNLMASYIYANYQSISIDPSEDSTTFHGLDIVFGSSILKASLFNRLAEFYYYFGYADSTNDAN